MILKKTRKLASMDETKLFLCFLAITGLTDFSRFFFGYWIDKSDA